MSGRRQCTLETKDVDERGRSVVLRCHRPMRKITTAGGPREVTVYKDRPQVVDVAPGEWWVCDQCDGWARREGSVR